MLLLHDSKLSCTAEVHASIAYNKSHVDEKIGTWRQPCIHRIDDVGAFDRVYASGTDRHCAVDHADDELGDNIGAPGSAADDSCRLRNM